MNNNTTFLLNGAVSELDNLECGEKFLVKDLFKGYVWKRLSISARLNLGTLFVNYAKNNPEKVIILDKTSSNQQMYKKSKS